MVLFLIFFIFIFYYPNTLGVRLGLEPFASKLVRSDLNRLLRNCCGKSLPAQLMKLYFSWAPVYLLLAEENTATKRMVPICCKIQVLFSRACSR
ncbi:hypothetical protein PR001_g28061 [Phytophthora rubi]|uniref:Uncharacterized protein n=1 Tax=Phytophthora rubi TaxID=129364 RepID=A0A6A3HBT5_9STRA|nr:hypothetical protein PR002_g28109 [Phytophthora rubi]KAE8967584.1 hypothetical protein PR001_g28061 [Phytophthora rubi]